MVKQAPAEEGYRVYWCGTLSGLLLIIWHRMWLSITDQTDLFPVAMLFNLKF